MVILKNKGANFGRKSCTYLISLVSLHIGSKESYKIDPKIDTTLLLLSTTFLVDFSHYYS